MSTRKREEAPPPKASSKGSLQFYLPNRDGVVLADEAKKAKVVKDAMRFYETSFEMRWSEVFEEEVPNMATPYEHYLVDSRNYWNAKVQEFFITAAVRLLDQQQQVLRDKWERQWEHGGMEVGDLLRFSHVTLVCSTALSLDCAC